MSWRPNSNNEENLFDYSRSIEKDAPQRTAEHQLHAGISLRDYFAAHALMGLLASTSTNEPTFEAYSKAAFHHADAMISTREGK